MAGATGTDRSQQNAAQVAIDNAAITTSVTTNVITFVSGYTPTAADVGNVVQVISGTNATANSFFNITAQTATTWTVNGNVVSSGTTVNLIANMGGALATLGKLAAALTVGSNKAYVTGAFTSTATITFAPSGVTPAGNVPQTRLIGYGAVRGDAGHATLTLQTNTGLTGITSAASGFTVEQIDVDCASLGTSTGIALTVAFGAIRNCKVANFTVKGLRLATNTLSEIADCEVTGGTAAATVAVDLAAAPQSMHRCFIHDNACPGLSIVAGQTAIDCLIVNNTGAASDGVQANGNCVLLNNTIHGNGRDGIRSLNAGTTQQIRNNILSNNGGFGLNYSVIAGPAMADIDGNAYFSNTSGARNNVDSTAGIFGVSPYVNTRDVILTVSPYVGPTTGSTANFGLNNTAGGGAACRAAGSPGAFPGLATTVGKLDMGAVQHADPVTGGLIGMGELAGGLQ